MLMLPEGICTVSLQISDGEAVQFKALELVNSADESAQNRQSGGNFV